MTKDDIKTVRENCEKCYREATEYEDAHISLLVIGQMMKENLKALTWIEGGAVDEETLFHEMRTIYRRGEKMNMKWPEILTIIAEHVVEQYLSPPSPRGS